EKDAAPEEQLLKRRGFGHGRNNVRSDTTAAKNLAAALGQLYLRAAGRLGVVVVVVEGDGLVIALNEPPAGSVILRGGEQEGGVFAELVLRLDQGFAKTSFTDDEPAIVVLKRAGDNLRGGGALSIDEDDERHVKLALGARGVIGAVRGGAAAMADDELVFVEETVSEADPLVKQAAGIIAQIEDEAVEPRCVEAVESLGELAVGGFIERGDVNVADAGAG